MSVKYKKKQENKEETQYFIYFKNVYNNKNEYEIDYIDFKDNEIHSH
jgi:hypothetical protein